MKSRTIFILFLATFQPLLAGSQHSSHPADYTPVPCLTWLDVKDLYSKTRQGKQPGDWDYPELKSYPNQEALIKFCERDLRLSLQANPDPLHLGRPLPAGKLSHCTIHRDPDNQMVYFVFGYESELITDLWIVYYYDPVQDCFILKSAR